MFRTLLQLKTGEYLRNSNEEQSSSPFTTTSSTSHSKENMNDLTYCCSEFAWRTQFKLRILHSLQTRNELSIYDSSKVFEWEPDGSPTKRHQNIQSYKRDIGDFWNSTAGFLGYSDVYRNYSLHVAQVSHRKHWDLDTFTLTANPTQTSQIAIAGGRLRQVYEVKKIFTTKIRKKWFPRLHQIQ